MKFEEVRQIVADNFAEPQCGEALKIANHLWRYLLHHSELQSRQVCEIVDSTIPANQKEDFMSTAEILRQEGISQGRLLALQEDVIEVLSVRFERVPEGLREAICEIADEPHLRRLLKAALRAASVEDFAGSLEA